MNGPVVPHWPVYVCQFRFLIGFPFHFQGRQRKVPRPAPHMGYARTNLAMSCLLLDGVVLTVSMVGLATLVMNPALS